MMCCKQETFLYWCIHCFMWIIITLPTLFFLLRVNHPSHETSSKLSTLQEGNHAPLMKHKICTTYSGQICREVISQNVSVKGHILHSEDKEMMHVLAGISFTRNHSECSRLLREMFCLEIYSSCNLIQQNRAKRPSILGKPEQLANNTHEFCENCSRHVRVGINVSLEGGIYLWLNNLSCLSEVFKRKPAKNETSGNNTCAYPLISDENATCRIPCDWSLTSSTLRDTFYIVMVLNMWAALIATVITIATLASFRQMRAFPHIVRFYILISSALYAASSLLPLRIGLAKFYCGDERYWHPGGHSSRPTVIEGAITHYFFLGFCFWSLCYVVNTYSVVVKHAQYVFVHPKKHHAIQFVTCVILPAMFVGINMLAKPPGYKFLFVDRMTSVFTSPVLEYLTFTLPLQISLGVAISLLWSTIRFVRKVRKNPATSQAIRPDDDVASFINAEKQFTKLAALFVTTVVVVLFSEVTLTYRTEYIHRVEGYFKCLKISANCSLPEVKIFFLSSVKACGPGFYCLLNFLLLFCNKDTRNVWKKWFIWVYNMFLCRCEQTDGKKYSTNLSKKTGRSRSLENKDSRVRSFTIETNASMDSLSNKIALGTSTALFDLDNTKAEVYVPLTTPYEGEIRHTQS